MQRRKPDLIVPIRDRRQHKRYLTLRNAGIAFAALVVLFIGISIRSEMQPRHTDSFGRLLERELPKVEAKPVEVVEEAAPPVDDHTAADPMLVAPAAREQWLYDSSTPTTSAATIEPIAAPVTLSPRTKGARVAIVGGPEGVSVVEQTRQRQTLRGGFGR